MSVVPEKGAVKSSCGESGGGTATLEYSLKQRMAAELYRRVNRKCSGDYAGKITFALLTCDVNIIQNMLEDYNVLCTHFGTVFKFLQMTRSDIGENQLRMLFDKVRIHQQVFNLADKVEPPKSRLPLVQYSSTKRFSAPLFRQISAICPPKYAGKITYILLRCDFGDIQRILEEEAALSISVKTIFNAMQTMSNSGNEEENLKMLIDWLTAKDRAGLRKAPVIKYSRETLFDIGRKFVCRKRIKVDIPEIIAEKRVFDQATGIKRPTPTEVMYLESNQKRYPFKPWTTSRDYHSYFRNEPMQ